MNFIETFNTNMAIKEALHAAACNRLGIKTQASRDRVNECEYRAGDSRNIAITAHIDDLGLTVDGFVLSVEQDWCKSEPVRYYYCVARVTDEEGNVVSYPMPVK